MNIYGLALLASLAIGTFIGALIVYIIVRTIFFLTKSKYPGLTIYEDIIILVSTYPVFSSAGYIVFCIPWNLALILSVGAYVNYGEWMYDEFEFIQFGEALSDANSIGILALAAWLIPVIVISIWRRIDVHYHKREHEKKSQ